MHYFIIFYLFSNSLKSLKSQSSSLIFKLATSVMKNATTSGVMHIHATRLNYTLYELLSLLKELADLLNTY